VSRTLKMAKKVKLSLKVSIDTLRIN